MREIVVLSGKGGTGKTTVAASLSVIAARKAVAGDKSAAVIADCDVDAANLALILRAQTRERHEFSGSSVAVVREERCGASGGCDRCLAVCRAGAISRAESGGPVVDPNTCEGCGVCREICPSTAFELVPVVTGAWFVSDTPHGPLVHARLRPGGESCGQLVTLVREKAQRIATAQGKDLVVADGPPGLGCPVLASLTGATAALIVTEPTYSAMHDLERVLSVTAHFGVPAMAAVNRCDLDSENCQVLERRCREHGVPVIGRIPYDREVTRVLAEGLTPVERGRGPAARAIEAIGERVLEALASARPTGAAAGPENASRQEVPPACLDRPNRDWSSSSRT